MEGTCIHRIQVSNDASWLGAIVEDIKEVEMEDKLYPKAQFEADIETIRRMNVSHEDKIEKGNALMNLYFNQNNESIIDPFSIADFRENILKEE